MLPEYISLPAEYIWVLPEYIPVLRAPGYMPVLLENIPDHAEYIRVLLEYILQAMEYIPVLGAPGYMPVLPEYISEDNIQVLPEYVPPLPVK